MFSVSLIVLAFAVSLDSFNVGLTYGLRSMRIPFGSIVIIACCSAASLLVAMLTGTVLAAVISADFAEKIGGFILISLGLWVIYQFLKPEKKETATSTKRFELKLEIKSLGLVVSILRKPLEADIDRSGTIKGLEAILLGLALSLDAFGAGIGAALLNFSPVKAAILTAFMSSSFVMIGMKAGRCLAGFSWLHKVSFLPGILLIALGIWKM